MQKLTQSYDWNKMSGGSDIEFYLEVPEHYVRTITNHCLIRVDGESGKRFGIHAGDMVVADLDRHRAATGVAVVWADADHTAFRFKKATIADDAVAIVHRLIPKAEAGELLYGELMTEVLV